ncbi:ferritin family protein [Pontiella agarivorans]|uniref:Ferritin family protein n=1 Tax=Pontiella agarivorans TaxID=3038953 RepID=A0ABU5MZR6_9BACT|nr:ferritin family protein [Pontiella agarivorans]MDZ8119675.1 ferritin family protein [Pontiella agarivorans]
MNNEELNELIEESIALELNAAALYKIFSQAVPADADFWWQLHLEERSHATLIRAARDSFFKNGQFPRDLVAESIEELKASNQKLRENITHFISTPPTRESAALAALALEIEIGEQHYTRFMQKEAENSIETVFQKLNRDDVEHERRIRERFENIFSEA